MKTDPAEYLRRVEECVSRSQVRQEGGTEGAKAKRALDKIRE